MEQTFRIENKIAFSTKEIILLQNKLGIPTCNILTKLCKFCKEPFKTSKYHKGGFFCTQECRSHFSQIKRRIVNISGSDSEIRREWKKLKQNGIYYQFPKGHEDFNVYYGLKKK